MPDMLVFSGDDAAGNPVELIMGAKEKVRVRVTTCCGRRGSQCECEDGPRYV